MKEIVENIHTRRLWINTNLFMLCLIHQLMLATPTSQDSAVTLNNTQSEQINMAALTKEMDILKLKLITVKNLTENDGGRFHKGSSRNMSNITQNERNILQIQNTIQELSKITDNGILDIGSLKERMNTLEMELEDLRRLYDNSGQEVRQDVGKFDSLLANLTQAHSKLSDQLLTRIIDIENTLKYHVPIQPEITDFYKAMEAKNFSWAAVNFEKIVSKNDIVKFIKESYKIVNNFDCYMKLARHFPSCDIPEVIYSVIKENNLWQKNESYADICRYAIIVHLLINIKTKNFRSWVDLPPLKCNGSEGFLVTKITPGKNYFTSFRYAKMYGYLWVEKNGVETFLHSLVQRNRHSEVGGIIIRKGYVRAVIEILDVPKNAQTLFCENNVRLDKDNYTAPLDNC